MYDVNGRGTPERGRVWGIDKDSMKVYVPGASYDVARVEKIPTSDISKRVEVAPEEIARVNAPTVQAVPNGRALRRPYTMKRNLKVNGTDVLDKEGKLKYTFFSKGGPTLVQDSAGKLLGKFTQHGEFQPEDSRDSRLASELETMLDELNFG